LKTDLLQSTRTSGKQTQHIYELGYYLILTTSWFWPPAKSRPGPRQKSSMLLFSRGGTSWSGRNRDQNYPHPAVTERSTSQHLVKQSSPPGAKKKTAVSPSCNQN